MDEVIMNVDEAAEFLRISKNNLYQLKARKQVPYHNVGERLVFLKSELIEWVKNSGK